MKTISRISAFVGIVVTAAGFIMMALASPVFAQRAAGTASVETTVVVSTRTAIGTVDGFHAALKRGDTQSALSYLSEDVVIFESGAVESNRAEYEAHHLKADAEFSAATSRSPVSALVIEEDRLATVLRVELVSGSFRGRPVNSRSIETMLLRKLNGQWRIAHIHWSSADLKK